MSAVQLKTLLDDLSSSNNDSDAINRLVVTRLAREHIPYRAMLGRVVVEGKVITPHIWVEADGCVIDYTAGNNAANEEIPQGVIPMTEAAADYQGSEIIIDPLPDYMYAVINH